jgi:AcrR family transcriptional regulator
VTDIVREVGTSPATFYQYFDKIETAVLALAGDVAKEAASCKGLAEGANLSGKAALTSVDKVIDGISGFCRDNDAALRVLDTSAGEGDARFKKIRATLMANLALPLAAVAGDTKEAKANAAAMAGLIVAASGSRGADSGATAAELRGAVGRLVFFGVTGKKPA